MPGVVAVGEGGLAADGRGVLCPQHRNRLSRHVAAMVCGGDRNMMTVQQAFDLALQHHQAGRLAEAEGMYRRRVARGAAPATSLSPARGAPPPHLPLPPPPTR